MGTIRIGLSGWLYPRWRGDFYPRGLPHKRELAYAASRFDTLEVNGSFYSLKRPSDFKRWHDETPAGFLFSVKGGRYITHMRKLVGIDAPLANFLAQGVLALDDKLGPILWQFPPQQRFDLGRFSDFFTKLPHTITDAAAIASKHDGRVREALLTPRSAQPLRHVVEVRNRSFACDAFYSLLRTHGLGLVVSDSPKRWPLLTEVTSDLVYVRLHGDEELYTSGYSGDVLHTWATRIQAWSKHADVYVYFDNDAKVFAPRDADTLIQLLGEPHSSANRRWRADQSRHD